MFSMFKNLDPDLIGIGSRDSELIELALSYGFKGLSLDLPSFAEQVRTQGFAKASRLITSAKMKIGSCALPIRLGAEEKEYQRDLEQAAALLEVAEQMQCTRLTATIEPGSDTRPYHENFEFHRRRLADVAGRLQARKMRLGLGFLAPIICRADKAFQFVQSFHELLLLVGTVGSSNLGICLDTWHWYVGGGTIESLRSVSADKIVAVVLADETGEASPKTARLDTRKLPGEVGTIDNVGVLTALSELGYDGPVTPASDQSQFKGVARDKVVKMAGAALDQVWKAAGLSPSGKMAVAGGR
jgi:sugar phosphate isomerase/epimerase